jgi:ATP-binding cassette, subfamily B, bacterial
MTAANQNQPEGRPSAGAVLAAQMSEAAAKRGKRRDVRPLARLLPYFARHARDAGLALVFLVLSTALTLTLTGSARLIVDRGFGGEAALTMGRWFALLGAVAVGLAITTALRFFYINKVGERIVADLREELYSHILTLDPGFFVEMRTGEVLSRMTADIQIVETLVSSSIAVTLRNILSVVGAGILLCLINARLTLVVIAIFPVIIAPIFLIGRVVRRATVLTQDRFAGAVGFAGEALDALETVQAFGREASSSRRFAEGVELVFRTSMTRLRLRSLMLAVVISLAFAGISLVLWVGAQAVAAKAMTPGALAQFLLLATFAAMSVSQIGETWGDVQKAAGATERIDELMRAKPRIAPPARPTPLPEPPRGEIAFESVAFAYPGRPDLPALKDFSLRIRAGETVALVGASGAGKSTVFRLLLRFHDPDRGVIRLDGVDLREADPRAVRARTALVAQDSPLFSGSALDNIRFGREDASREEIRQAAAEAQALGFVEALPQGLDTSLGERARSLSGGQRQRIAIARALVRDAPILLLDEATSALDAENERLVQAALQRAMEARTTLVIAHRLSTVQRADRIVVMDQGRVVEEGRHAELVAKGGLYAKFAKLQFGTAA